MDTTNICLKFQERNPKQKNRQNPQQVKLWQDLQRESRNFTLETVQKSASDSLVVVTIFMTWLRLALISLFRKKLQACQL